MIQISKQGKHLLALSTERKTSGPQSVTCPVSYFLFLSAWMIVKRVVVGYKARMRRKTSIILVPQLASMIQISNQGKHPLALSTERKTRGPQSVSFPLSYFLFLSAWMIVKHVVVGYNDVNKTCIFPQTCINHLLN